MIYYQISKEIDVNMYVVWCLENKTVAFNGRKCFRSYNVVLFQLVFPDIEPLFC